MKSGFSTTTSSTSTTSLKSESGFTFTATRSTEIAFSVRNPVGLPTNSFFIQPPPVKGD